MRRYLSKKGRPFSKWFFVFFSENNAFYEKIDLWKNIYQHLIYDSKTYVFLCR